MSDELRAAAERILSFGGYLAGDAEKVARAYLADLEAKHPCQVCAEKHSPKYLYDAREVTGVKVACASCIFKADEDAKRQREAEDALPVTIEWLLTLPNAIPNGSTCYFQLWKAANFKLFVQSDMGFVIAAFGQTIRLKDEWVKTRVQIRRLLEALGVEVKDAK